MNIAATKKDLPAIYEFMLVANLLGSTPSSSKLVENIGAYVETDNYLLPQSKIKAREMVKSNPASVLFKMAMSIINDNRDNGYFDYNMKHRNNESLNEIYTCLVNLGYQMADEEKALQNGTHELFKEGAKIE